MGPRVPILPYIVLYLWKICLFYRLWMSPHLPRLPNSAKASDGESRTGFKKDLLDYLSQYDRSINHWKSIVARADFSSVNVFFVASVPGNYRGQSDQSKWGHKRLASILKSHVEVRFIRINLKLKSDFFKSSRN